MSRERRTVLIVDDEPLARQRLRELVTGLSGFAVMGEAGRLSEAREFLKARSPDVVLLDIQLFGDSGFDLLEDMPEQTRVIFVTAHEQYAVRAFEVNALDYLLKPVQAERLRRALNRLDPPAEPSLPLEADDRVLLQVGRRRWFQPVGEIAAITAEGDYTTLWITNGYQATTRRSLAEWLTRLPRETFVRIHRNALVNARHVESFERLPTGGVRLLVRGTPTPLDASRRRAPTLLRRLRTP